MVLKWNLSELAERAELLGLSMFRGAVFSDRLVQMVKQLKDIVCLLEFHKICIFSYKQVKILPTEIGTACM